MSATVLLHPASRDLMGVVDWGFAMVMSGYDVRVKRLYGDAMTLIARPPETARTNEHIAKMPRYCGQFGKSTPNDLPPSAA